ncbi:MAG: hypothetical protein LBQ89_07880 [Treponema sp.]|nr:hypothetical protein [Treponema sp.]
MKEYRIEFVIKVPKEATDEQVKEWAQYMVGDTGRLSSDNPLYDVSFDPILRTFKIEGIVT